MGLRPRPADSLPFASLFLELDCMWSGLDDRETASNRPPINPFIRLEDMYLKNPICYLNGKLT